MVDRYDNSVHNFDMTIIRLYAMFSSALHLSCVVV